MDRRNSSIRGKCSLYSSKIKHTITITYMLSIEFYIKVLCVVELN